MTLCAALVLALTFVTGCSRGAGSLGELIPGKGTSKLKIGETTVDQAISVLGSGDGSARENSTTTSSGTVYEQIADIAYGSGLTVTFRGESPTSLLGGDGGLLEQFNAFREKNMGKLDAIHVRAAQDARSAVKTDKGVSLMDPASRVKEVYGKPAASIYSQHDGWSLFFPEGLVLTIGPPPGQKDVGKANAVVTRITVRKPFAEDELRDRSYKRDFDYE